MTTTIQIDESMRRKLKVLASYHDLSYNELLEELVNVFESVIPFKDEKEFGKWFEDNLEKFGFKEVVERRKRSSPDYRLKDGEGNMQEVELELLGKNFIYHDHDPEKVDQIICLFSEEDKIKEVPVTSVIRSNDLKEQVIDHGHTTISLPKSLHEDVEEFISDTGFTSVSDFTKHLFRDIIAGGGLEDESLTEEEVQKIRKRLERLGYID
ncbi:MAG: ribbon-helix-helix domain-containing protein [Candidatus Nanohaloarchaea archaeon]|nr:ribbon-helix-helix domain-containing protein [Candidatus Nanohaloarchaea archaeon]